MSPISKFPQTSSDHPVNETNFSQAYNVSHAKIPFKSLDETLMDSLMSPTSKRGKNGKVSKKEIQLK